jgi:hypothetical protein
VLHRRRHLGDVERRAQQVVDEQVIRTLVAKRTKRHRWIG